MFKRSILVIGAVLASTDASLAQTTFSDLVDKTLTNDQGSVVISADGTLSGQFGSNQLTATWDVEDGLFCRQGSIGDRTLERACQSISIRGNQVSFINQDGSVSSTYSIGE